MSGIVFNESSNIYQDQAKVLFDYYKQAAELIVSQEMELEDAIKKAQYELDTMQKDYEQEITRQEQYIKQKTTWMYVLFITIIGGLIMYLIIMKNLKPTLERYKANANNNLNTKKQQIQELKNKYANIKRDYQVSKLGVVYVPVASHIPFEDKNFIIDYTGFVPEIPFTLSSLKQPDALKVSVNKLQQLINNVPVVESSQEVEVIDTSNYSISMQEAPLYDFMGGLDRHMRNLGYILRDVNKVSVSLPIVRPNSKEYNFLKRHGTFNPGNAPIFKIFDLESHNANIATFEQLNDMKKSLDDTSGEFVEFFKSLMMQLAESAQILAQMKVDCTNKIMDFSNSIFMNTLRSSYNHYSPILEAEEIERIRAANFNYQEIGESYTPFRLNPSSRMRFDLISNNWVADDGSRSSYPFGMHQIYEEIMMPVIYNLMQETRIERLKIYNHIKDQKLDYLNQWHRDTEDFYARNRSESNDLINRMRETFSEYSSALNTLKALQETENQMGASGSLDSTKVEAKTNTAETLASFEMQGNQFLQQQEEFMDYMDRLKDDIDAQAEKFGYIECFEASLRDDEARKLARATEELQNLDPRRKKLAKAGAHFATMSEIPPEPNIESQTFEDFTMNLVKMADDALKNLDNVINSEETEQTETQIENASEPEKDEDNNITNTLEEVKESESEERVETRQTETDDDENFDEEEKDEEEEEDEDEEDDDEEDMESDEDIEISDKKDLGLSNEEDLNLDPNHHYSIVITDLGSEPMTAIIALSDMLNVDINDMKEFLSHLPVEFCSGLNLDEVKSFMDEIEELGISVKLQEDKE